jgi:hypothetical protein
MQRKSLGKISVDFDTIRSTTDYIFHIRLTLEKKLYYSFREQCCYICLSGKIFANLH